MANVGNFRNRSVNAHNFSLVPRGDVPRSKFRRESGHKTTFDAGYLIPIYVDEVLPGDVWRMSCVSMTRLATPIAPLMDNIYLDTFWFFVPNRLVWDNWVKLMGEQDDPGDSIDYLVPQITSPEGGYETLTLYDYFGLPVAGQITGSNQVTHSALFLRAYNLIWNELFRDENLQDRVAVPKDDGPDSPTLYTLLKRGKRKDYFTSCLPWPQKGEPVTLSLAGDAPVYGSALQSQFANQLWQQGGEASAPNGTVQYSGSVAGSSFIDADSGVSASGYLKLGTKTLYEGVGAAYDPPYADLTDIAAFTINQMRTAFQIQKLIERDARGGTRYTEMLMSHFGVVNPDFRLQRPEYLGGGSTMINITPIAQTSSTDAETPQGNLAAVGYGVTQDSGFSYAATEHGMIIGLCSVRADLTYQQGLHRMWSRRTRYDYYFPAFAMLGEQAVFNKEIYAQGTVADDAVFGYQERWAELRYKPSQITGLFRSTNPIPLDFWHLAQEFDGLPQLNTEFIEENPPIERVLAVGEAAGGQQFISDWLFKSVVARPIPMFSVPGLIDHF